MKNRIFGLSVVVLTFFGFIASPAMALEASKAVAAMGELVSIPTAAASEAAANAEIDPNATTPTSDDSGWATVLTAQIKTANQKELAFDMALQCGLVTDTTVRSKGGDKDGAKASASIAVRIKVTYEDGTVKFAKPWEDLGTEYKETDIFSGPTGVTYCSRIQTLEAKFAGLNCTADLTTGVVTCEDPEELRLILETLNANAFNYMLMNVPPGVHDIEVQARARAAAETFGTQLGDAAGAAFIGLGSLHVDEVRLVNSM